MSGVRDSISTFSVMKLGRNTHQMAALLIWKISATLGVFFISPIVNQSRKTRLLWEKST